MKETTVFIFGILLTVVPFLGVPEAWRQYAVMAMGTLLIFIGYLLRRQRYLEQLDRGDGDRAEDTFIETTETLFDERALK